MTDEGVQRDKIEVTVGVLKLMGVASLVSDVVIEPFLSSQSPGSVDQQLAVVHSDDDDAGLGSPPEGAHLDAGPAANGQDAPRALHRDVREVGL